MSRTKAVVALSVLLALVVLMPAMAAFAQMEGGGDAPTNVYDIQVWIAIIAAAAMGVASSMCGMAQGRAVSVACEGMARNPSAGGQIRGSLIIGLVLIESLAIYTLLIGLVLIFLRWPTA
ncbi:MAG: ATP synthase F0 subunit C [Acidobacteriota bacterium]|jgi:F-type H+-transporting ATPase subunit c